ncbi:hypothetical protein A2U01_0113881, partial [Trifolium medium]|nr:hypothetical protein [Trifolium medium]
MANLSSAEAIKPLHLRSRCSSSSGGASAGGASSAIRSSCCA